MVVKMKSKIIFCFIIILTLFLTVSAISASENVTCDNLTSVDDDLISQGEVEIIGDGEEVNKSSTEISAPDKTSYVDYDDEITVTLKSNGTGLANKSVLVTLNDVKYNKTTDLNGKVSVNFKLKSGTYLVSYSFEGDENYTSSNGTSTITIRPDIVTSFEVISSNVVYREGENAIFQVRLVDVVGNPVSGKSVTIIVGGKTFVVDTDDNGIATVYLNLNQGSYVVEYFFSENGRYIASSGSFQISVKPSLKNGYGYWVNKWSMKKVNFKKLAKLGTKQIFLLHTAFAKYGKKTVLKWIQKAHKYGMKVHIWMSVFYKGKFIKPVTKKGKINYKYMNKMIKKAKYYSSLGVDGMHFDYLRFSGKAYKYKNGVKAVNYFVKKASKEVRSVNPNIILSAAIMPEPTSMKHYYGQDVSTMSKYMDVLVPMIYKGNYHASTKWIKKTTKKFVKMSKGAKIWTGLQTYKSDSNIKKLSYNKLFKDAKAAKKGGASGVVLFRFGLTKYINFNKL
jgi:hypothetical protein